MRDLTEKEKEMGERYRPVGWKVLLLADEVEEKTESGMLFLPDISRDRQQISQDKGRILAVGQIAFLDASVFGDEPERKPRVGDKVLMNRHCGYRMVHKEPGGSYDLRVVNDKDINMVLEEGNE